MLRHRLSLSGSRPTHNPDPACTRQQVSLYVQLAAAPVCSSLSELPSCEGAARPELLLKNV
jgi:hypothetical protein